MFIASSLALTLLAAQPTADVSRPAVAPANATPTRFWLAQEEDKEEPRGKPGVRPPIRPGARRFMGREGLKNTMRRHPLANKKPGDAADSADGANSGSRPPPPSPRPSASGSAPGGSPPPAAPRPSTPTTTAARSGGGADGAEGADIDFAARAKRGKFSFEFSKAEIVDVVKAISNLMRRNFIIPEKLKSQRITILSPTKITAGEAYQVFLAALQVNGITVVRSGKFYKLIEAKAAIKAPIPTCLGPEDDCPRYSDLMITMLIQLKHVEATQINPVLKSLISKEGELTMFQPSNALIISEYAPNLTRLRKIIEALDIPGFDDELQIVRIKYATATEIADKLTQVFEVQAKGRPGAAGSRAAKPKPPRGRKTATTTPAASDGGGEVSISKIVPDDRTNQIIIKANRRSFEAIQRLIDRLDIPMEDSESGNVHVVSLQNASAEDLSSTLSSLAQGQGRTGAAPRPKGGTPKQAGGSTAAVLFEGEVKITADKATNSLIIVASAHDYRAMKRLIEKLDTPRRQVYVEAAILEVTVSDSDEFGVNWHTPMRFSQADLGSELGGKGTFGFLQSAQSSSGISPTLGALSDPTALLAAAGGSIMGIVGKGRTISVGDDEITLPAFGVILKALQSASNAQILSTPHILTTDNEEASIEVGQKIPFQRGTSLGGLGNLGGLGAAAGIGGAGAGALGGALGGLGGLGSMFSSTDRIDVSLKLTLTPQINQHGKIRLEIDEQIEDLVGREERTQQPITANRSAKTVVVVDDQQTVVIGGLMRDRTRDSESKIPILGDLPVLGWMFRQRSTEVEKVNLLLVLTPYIIRDASDFQRIFERKLDEHETFAAEYYGHKRAFRAHIDYARKRGPLAQLVATVRREKAKYENGGSGDGSQTLVQPGAPDTSDNGETIPVPPELDGDGGDFDGDDGDFDGDDGDFDDDSGGESGGEPPEPN